MDEYTNEWVFKVSYESLKMTSMMYTNEKLNS